MEEEKKGWGEGCSTDFKGSGTVPDPSQEAPAQYLEVQVQNPHLMHEEDPIADLPDKHHGVHLRQLIVLIHNPLEELAALDAACTDPSTGCFRASGTPPGPLPPLLALTTPRTGRCPVASQWLRTAGSDCGGSAGS